MEREGVKLIRCGLPYNQFYIILLILVPDGRTTTGFRTPNFFIITYLNLNLFVHCLVKNISLTMFGKDLGMGRNHFIIVKYFISPKKLL